MRSWRSPRRAARSERTACGSSKIFWSTETRLIANPQAMQDPEKRAKIDQIALMLDAALTAGHKVALKLNVVADKLDAVIKL